MSEETVKIDSDGESPIQMQSLASTITVEILSKQEAEETEQELLEMQEQQDLTTLDEEEEGNKKGGNRNPKNKNLKKLEKMSAQLVVEKLRPGTKYNVKQQSSGDSRRHGFLASVTINEKSFEAFGTSFGVAKLNVSKLVKTYLLSLPLPENIVDLLKRKPRGFTKDKLPEPGSVHPYFLLSELLPDVSYQVVSNPAPSTNNLYIMAACYEGKIHQGVGKYKKIAKSDAARKILEAVFDYKFPVVPGLAHYEDLFGQTDSSEASEEQTHPVQQLVKLKGQRAVFVDKGFRQGNMYTWQVLLGGNVYEGQGCTKEQAKCVAAAHVLAALWGFDPLTVQEVIEKGLWAAPQGEETDEKPKEVKVEQETQRENPLVILLRLRPQTEYNCVVERGMPPNVEFTFECILDNEHTFRGTGRNKKQAKMRAAQATLEYLAAQGEDVTPREIRAAGTGKHYRETQRRKAKDVCHVVYNEINEKTALQILYDLRGRLDYMLVDSRIEPPNTWFKFSVVVDGRTYFGEASSKQDAKRKCAENALRKMQEEGLIDIPESNKQDSDYRRREDSQTEGYWEGDEYYDDNYYEEGYDEGYTRFQDFDYRTARVVTELIMQAADVLEEYKGYDEGYGDFDYRQGSQDRDWRRSGKRGRGEESRSRYGKFPRHDQTDDRPPALMDLDVPVDADGEESISFPDSGTGRGRGSSRFQGSKAQSHESNLETFGPFGSNSTGPPSSQYAGRGRGRGEPNIWSRGRGEMRGRGGPTRGRGGSVRPGGSNDWRGGWERFPGPHSSAPPRQQLEAFTPVRYPGVAARPRAPQPAPAQSATPLDSSFPFDHAPQPATYPPDQKSSVSSSQPPGAAAGSTDPTEGPQHSYPGYGQSQAQPNTPSTLAASAPYSQSTLSQVSNYAFSQSNAAYSLPSSGYGQVNSTYGPPSTGYGATSTSGHSSYFSQSSAPSQASTPAYGQQDSSHTVSTASYGAPSYSSASTPYPQMSTSQSQNASQNYYGGYSQADYSYWYGSGYSGYSTATSSSATPSSYTSYATNVGQSGAPPAQSVSGYNPQSNRSTATTVYSPDWWQSHNSGYSSNASAYYTPGAKR